MADEKPIGDADKKLTDDPAFKQMQQAIQGITLLVQQGAANQKSMQDNFSKMIEKLGEPASRKTEVALEDQNDAINDLDNVSLMQLVVSEVGRVVDEKIGGVTDTLNTTRQSINDTRLTGEIKQIMSTNPDFMEWKTEMAALAKDNPTLTIERVYKLAKLENPEKAQELAEKYDESDKKPETGYLSLMPTGGGFDDADGENAKTKEEAMNAAWDATVAEFPGLANMGEG